MFGVFIMLLVMIGNKYQNIANICIYIYTHVFAGYIYKHIIDDLLLYISCMRLGALSLK